jgi:dihydroorotate dehydrogenase
MLAELGAHLIRGFAPETAHTLTLRILKTGLGVPGRAAPPPGLAVTLKKSGLTLASPIGLAAGFDKNCEVPAAMARFGFGFVECGTVTPRPQAGNPRPRLFRLTDDRAVINRMGFNNEGLAVFVERLKKYDGAVPLGANVGANKDATDRIGDYVTGIEATAAFASYITINISSPNTPGLRGLQDRDALIALLAACGKAARHNKPVFLKLAPDLDEAAIDDMCAVIAREGEWLSGLILSNTTISRPDTLKSPHKGEAGGLSGAPLFHPSTQVLSAFAERVGGAFDLIGAGGISNADHVRAKLKAGASAVQLYSALVYEGPGLARRLNQALSDTRL